jgi:protoporphyrin/coproporphyrin ferrochelatase
VGIDRLTGVLLINLGTPLSPTLKHVFQYLNEFLTDERVIDFQWLKRQLLVRGIIVPTRVRQSTALYRKLWTDEGSPLLFHGKAVQEKLQKSLGSKYKVALGMRYQFPSIKEALHELREAQVDEIIVVPLFPQYASATTGSVHQKVMDEVRRWQIIPELTFINSFPDEPHFIGAFCERAMQYPLETYEHILFSFHGLPERYLQDAHPSMNCVSNRCSDELVTKNQYCYKAQCYATARAIAEKLNLNREKYTVCFQSRLGKEPWIQPYTQEIITERAARGDKRVLVFCPSFVCDCLETTIEISHEYGEEFKKLGGEVLQLVEGLNSHPTWIDALQHLVKGKGRAASL